MRLKTPARALNRNRKRSERVTAAAITKPKSEGRRNFKCPKFRVGRGTPLRAIVSAGMGDCPPPTCARWRCRGGCVNRLCLGARRDEYRYTDWGARARPRALPPEDQPYGAMRSVS